MVKFHGRLSRDQVQEKLREADCFAMISENEVFGLVYLEAMASGCLTIASRDGGVDGIIVDSVNGFLCEQGNAVELSEILNKVSTLEKSEAMRIRQEALKTVSDYSDNRVAQRYLTDICGA